MALDIWQHINFKRATREHREKAALWMLNHLEALPELMSALENDLEKAGTKASSGGSDRTLSTKAAYILEMMALKDLSAIAQQLPELACSLPKFNSDSIQRALLHIMNLWLSKHETISTLDQNVIECLTEHCFDKLIQKPEAAVAVQAHAMSCLSHLSLKNPWIKEPLVDILIKNMAHQSPGYCARARHILEDLNRG